MPQTGPNTATSNTTVAEIGNAEAGDYLIHVFPENPGATLLETLSAFEVDYIEILEEERANQPGLQDREEP